MASSSTTRLTCTVGGECEGEDGVKRAELQQGEVDAADHMAVVAAVPRHAAKLQPASPRHAAACPATWAQYVQPPRTTSARFLWWWLSCGYTGSSLVMTSSALLISTCSPDSRQSFSVVYRLFCHL